MKLSTSIRQVFTRTVAYGDGYAVVACVAELNPSTGEWMPVSEPYIVRIIRAVAQLVGGRPVRPVFALAAASSETTSARARAPKLTWYSELFSGNSQAILSWFGARPPTLS